MNTKQSKIDKLSVADAEKNLQRTAQALKAAKIELRSAKNAERKRQTEERRAVENRLKLHAGGFLEMVGMLRYVYERDGISDNPQDSLIANLIVGILLRASSELEKASVDTLHKVWIEGSNFRLTDKGKRVLPNINPNINKLTELVLPLLSKSKQQINGNETTTKTEESAS